MVPCVEGELSCLRSQGAVCTGVLSVDCQSLQISRMQTNRNMGRGNRSYLAWEPRCPPNMPRVTGRNPPRFQGLIIDMRHVHTWPRTSLVNRGGVPAGRARPAQQSPAHPMWCFSLQQSTFLPAPHEAGLEFMPDDRGTLGQGGCWVSQEHGLSNSCAAGCPPRPRLL